MPHNPYLVVGTGRSGTSTVAGILHNKMDVFMGYEFPPANSTNPDGFWEDIEIYKANKAFYFGRISYSTWKRGVTKIIAERQKLDKPWGFKESRMADLLGLYLGLLKDPKIIRCKRKKELVVSSWVRCYGLPINNAFTLWQERETTLDNILAGRDSLKIYFDERRIPDKEIISLIENKWKEKING